MKKIFILFLSAIMLFCCVLGIAACSNDNAGDNSGSINQPITPPKEPQPSIPPALAVEIPTKSSQVSTNIGWPLKLSGYTINISNATALGIAKETKSTVQPLNYSGKSNQISLMSKSMSLYTDDAETTRSYIVKSTNEYNSNNPDLSSNGIEKVTFTKTITDEVRTEINGSNFIIARNDERTIVPTLTFDCIYNYIYYVYYENNLILDNISDNCELDINKEKGVISLLNVDKDAEYEIKYNAIGENIFGSQIVVAEDDANTIKSTISFIPVADYKYSLYLDGNLVYENLEDNSDIDINNEVGTITISNLEKDKEYEIRYEYAKNEIVVTQEQITGEIDKLYVLGNYTFISYVPNGTSLRPNNDNLVYDTDGIATYDKCNYFSNGSNRQSFIIDNTTGYVYDIKAFNIKEIQGGLLISANDNYIYDFKINDNDEVEIYSLFTNDSIEWYSCFKDKYGNKYIQNNRLNTYDASSKTYFYVYEDCNYELTSNGEAIKFIWYNKSNTGTGVLSHASIILANGQERNLTVNDSFDINYKIKRDDWDFCEHCYYKVEKGVVYGRSLQDLYNDSIEKYIEVCTLYQYDAINDLSYYRWFSRNDYAYYNLNYLEKYDIILHFNCGKLYYADKVWDNFRNTAEKGDDNTTSWTGFDDSNGLIDVNPWSMTILDDKAYTFRLLIDNCSVSDDCNSILTYGVNGNTYYDIVVEEVDGEIVVNKYVKGTYTKPQIKILLQPLNKQTKG